MTLTNSSGKFENIVPKKHICFISYYFPPMGGGGVQRITKFLKYFDYQSFDTTVLTVKPSFYYTTDDSLARDIPENVKIIKSGSLDPFRFWYLVQKIKQKLFSTPIPELNHESSGKMRKVAMSLFVPDSRLLWLPFALFKLIREHRKQPFDLLIASIPPFTAGLVGVIFKKITGIPLMIDFRDAWTANPYLPDIPVWKRLNQWLEGWCITQANGLIFVNSALEEYYCKKYEPAPSKCITIRNGFDPEDFSFPAPGLQKNSRFTLGIVGTIYSQGNRPVSLLKAVERLSRKQPDLHHSFRLVFIGKWSADFLKIIQQEISNPELIEMIPYLPHREALEKMTGFDAISLAVESDLPGAAQLTPGRIYEYIFSKRPVLAMCPEQGDLAAIIRNCRAGEVIEYHNIPEIEKILEQWISCKDTFAEKYKFINLDQYSREFQTKQLQQFIEGFF